MVTFKIPDMTCGHCAATIAKAIAAEDAGARVEFDLPGHLVHVAGNSAIPAELESAIREAGYSPSAVEAQPARSGGCGCGCGSPKGVDLPQAQGSARGGCCI
ncbi:heavy-metal-associated domain-containing protein [Ramlibacter sp. XY19]|uniref:heavy-metal-associated domain-containing protein n=1 Tax=Ramlibacter paludis TaxID=2908000 RepID=UPI0023DB8C1B|nr:heavy-metal-associated domain-containing protein [Ramlibacter paludis]MCG2594108.1 heavy-metal-associated domain-containing protein [Ramlibacter paludis]